MEQTLYDYSPIASRPRVTWPGDASVAFYIGLNIEHYKLDVPSTSIAPVTAGMVPDPMNYSWRDFGPRVGVWRLMELLDDVDMRASVLLNSEVCERYPQIIEAGNERGWRWLGHGQNNSILHTGMEIEEERAYLREMTDVIESATGQRPTGWLGPALTETLNTPQVLRELGYTYVLDWCNDEQPYPLNVDGMISVPYTVELNDVTLFVGRNLSGDDYVRMVEDTLEQLLADGTRNGRVMALALHPFIINQPHRHKYLAKALERIRATEGVWVTTSDEIAEHYLAHHAGAGASEVAK